MRRNSITWIARPIRFMILTAAVLALPLLGSAAPGEGTAGVWQAGSIDQQSPAQQQGSLASAQAELGCAGKGIDSSTSPAVAMASTVTLAGNSQCKCGKCPRLIPEVTCGKDEKRCTGNGYCNFPMICDGQKIQCTVKVPAQFCVPKSQPCPES